MTKLYVIEKSFFNFGIMQPLTNGEFFWMLNLNYVFVIIVVFFWFEEYSQAYVYKEYISGNGSAHHSVDSLCLCQGGLCASFL